METNKVSDVIVYAKANKVAFWCCTVACAAFFLPMIIFGEALQGVVDSVMFFITHTTDWIWHIVMFGSLAFVLWLALGRYGKVKLGGPDTKPDFTTFVWFSTLFCSTTGGGLVYWSMLEPLFYMLWPPFAIEPLSAESAQYALAYGYFHWGFSAWAVFAVPASVFAYSYYVRKQPYLFPSFAFKDTLGVRASEGWIGKVINALIAFALVGGITTSLGFIIPMVSRLFSDFAGVPDTLFLKIMICLIITVIYCISSYVGLKRGIAKLSTWNMYLAIAMVAYFLLAGNPNFSLSLFSDNLGVLINDYIRMSFYTDPITRSGFPQDWTVFYWAWWLSYAMYLGLFSARISKGRTLRSLILTMTISGAVACMFFFTAFGGNIVDAVLNRGIDLGAILADQGGPAIVSWAFNDLPGSAILIPAMIFYLIIASATTNDSAAYTLANMVCDEVPQDIEPQRWNRLYWAGMITIAAIALMIVGGMRVVQLSSVFTAIPLLPIIILFAITIVKWLRDDFGPGEILVTDKYENKAKETE